MNSFRILFLATAVGATSASFAFGIYGHSGLSGGFRWDNEARVMNGVERSLQGGLRYSVQGGNYQAYRDTFTWSGVAPTVAAFTAAVQSAFNDWTVVDPVSGLGTTLSFVEDLGTATSTSVSGGVRMGAEIDLLGATSGQTFGVGDGGLRAEAFFSAVNVTGGVTLTSGTTNYTPAAISGADVTMNSNSNALWTLDWFRTILRHEIGHSLGLADVDNQSGPGGTFIDDNYVAGQAGTTLTNSFAGLINPLNPAASPLNLYTIPNNINGFDAAGVEILMESNISNFFLTNSLQNDDFAGRQFLYPTAVPEPATMLALGAGAALIARRRRKA